MVGVRGIDRFVWKKTGHAKHARRTRDREVALGGRAHAHGIYKRKRRLDLGQVVADILAVLRNR